jgi:hypothetical protein
MVCDDLGEVISFPAMLVGTVVIIICGKCDGYDAMLVG